MLTLPSSLGLGLPTCQMWALGYVSAGSLLVLASVICLCAQGPGWEEGRWGIWGLCLHTQQLGLPSRFRAWAAGMRCCSHGLSSFA